MKIGETVMSRVDDVTWVKEVRETSDLNELCELLKDGWLLIGMYPIEGDKYITKVHCQLGKGAPNPTDRN